MYGTMVVIYCIVALVICVVFGIVTANLAKKKGYSYGAFFAVGFFLCLIGLIIVLVIEDKNKKVPESEAANSLLKYKQLMDEGVITEEEFNDKKSELLKSNAKEEPPVRKSSPSVANGEQQEKNGLRIASIALAAIAGFVNIMSLFSLINLGIQNGDFFYLVFQLNLFNLLSNVICIAAAVICIFSVLKRSKQLAIMAIALSALAVLLALACIANLANAYGVPFMSYVTTLLYPILLVAASALAMKY